MLSDTIRHVPGYTPIENHPDAVIEFRKENDKTGRVLFSFSATAFGVFALHN